MLVLAPVKIVIFGALYSDLVWTVPVSDDYLLGDLVEGLGLLSEHVLSLVPVPGPGALRVHLHCHLMRAGDAVTRGTGGPGSPGSCNGTYGSELLETESHHYFSLIRLSLFVFSDGSFSAKITAL